MSIETNGRETAAAKPVFTVMVPSYNPAPYFEEAVRSALDQMGPDDELLIQDAGSTDGTADVIAALEREDKRVKAVIEPDKGQSDALNRALARAKPSWVIWLNADDLVLPGALDAVREAIMANPDADLFYGDTGIIREDGTPVDFFSGRPLDLKPLLRHGIMSFSGSIIMRDSTLRELGGLRPEQRCAMDYDLQMRIARSNLRQVKVPARIGVLRFHESSKSANLWKGFIKESHDIRMAYSETPSEKASALFGSAWHVAQVPFFKIRLTPTYRKMRKRVKAWLQ